jgi:Phosphatidylinositol 5-phosphate phosphatase
VAERNADYAEITRKVQFPMGRTLNSHDYVFWCGDFNYRIDMDKDELKELLKHDLLDDVLKFDQLRIQQDQGRKFSRWILRPSWSFGDLVFQAECKQNSLQSLSGLSRKLTPMTDLRTIILVHKYECKSKIRPGRESKPRPSNYKAGRGDF